MLYIKMIFLTQIEKFYNPSKLIDPNKMEPSIYRDIFPPVMHGSLGYQIFAVSVLIIFTVLIVMFIRMIYKAYKLAKQNVDTFNPKDNKDNKKE